MPSKTEHSGGTFRAYAGAARDMELSLIIATKGRPADLRDALAGVAACAPAGTDVIIVDGDPQRSAEPVVEAFRQQHPQRRIRYVPSRPGLTLQRNIGIDAAAPESEVVLFIDDDAVLMPGSIDALLDAYRDPSVVGVWGLVTEDRLAPRLGRNRHLRRLLVGGGRQGSMTGSGFRVDILDRDRPHDVEWMGGAFMSARRALAAEVRFDERLGGYALGEDDDFTYRLSRRGRLLWLPTHMALHRATGVGSSDPRQFNRLVVINRTYLFRKNFARTRRSWAGFCGLLLILAGHRLVNREWRGLQGLAEGVLHVVRGRPVP